MLDSGKCSVILTHPSMLCLGWRTRHEKRAISFTDAVDERTFIQAEARLAGMHSRIAAFELGTAGFKDYPIKYIPEKA
jgi:hypothetical protein